MGNKRNVCKIFGKYEKRVQRRRLVFVQVHNSYIVLGLICLLTSKLNVFLGENVLFSYYICMRLLLKIVTKCLL